MHFKGKCLVFPHIFSRLCRIKRLEPILIDMKGENAVYFAMTDTFKLLHSFYLIGFQRQGLIIGSMQVRISPELFDFLS